jgi:acyl-CoA synthetase (AMP-forming)/AMP-acid ligase II
MTSPEAQSLRIGDLPRRQAQRQPQALALTDDEGSLTWEELADRCSSLASALRGLGFQRGDRVVSAVSNSTQAVEMLFGSAIAGLVLVPISPALSTNEFDTLVQDSAPAGAVVSPSALSALRPEAFRTGIVVGGEDIDVPDGWHDYEAIVRAGDPHFIDPEVRSSDLRTIRYTSGTTATPKGLLSTHEQMFPSIDSFLKAVNPPRGTFMQLLPLTSGAGIWMQVAAAYRGDPSVLTSKRGAADALAVMSRHKVVHACGVPTILSRLADRYAQTPDAWGLAPNLMIGFTGASMPVAVLRRVLESLPVEIYHAFGAGELGGLVSYLTHREIVSALNGDAPPDRLKSAGRPAAYAQVVLRDDFGQPVGKGELGEITVSSPSNFSGYWNRPEESEATLRDGWVYTGDIGRFDDDGYLYVVDRKKDMILTGGMNVAPAEVEAVLAAHPAVKEVAVVGLPDDDWGEVVTAVVVRKGTVTEQELIDFARKSLAGYKTPKSVRFEESLPQNSVGKILKRELRARLISPERTHD